MSTVELTAVRLGGDGPGRPLLLLGPSLGTSSAALWQQCAQLLAPHYDVVGWELPGHGAGRPATGPFTVADLAGGVAVLAERVSRDRGRPGEAYEYAGVSMGGAVGLQLLLDHPARVRAATLLCTGARIGTPQGWAERAEQARAQGTPSLVTGSAQRWFAAGFLDREPETAATLLHALREVDGASYAWTCDALAALDLVARLPEITIPVTAVAGAEDGVTPPEGLRRIAEGVRDGQLVVLDGVAHLAPAEAPAIVADLIRERPRRADEALRAGFAERRAVLGDAHVDRAVAATTQFSADFQDFITRYAWGTVWTRPGLSRRERSLMTLTALTARGHLEELALHVRAARRNGLTLAEIAECLQHAAIYCGVPAANAAVRVAQQVLDEQR